MGSIIRKMRRVAAFKNGDEWPGREQPSAPLKCGGYRTIRPTKGKLRMSGRRLAAIDRMNALIGPYPRKI